MERPKAGPEFFRVRSKNAFPVIVDGPGGRSAIIMTNGRHFGEDRAKVLKRLIKQKPSR